MNGLTQLKNRFFSSPRPSRIEDVRYVVIDTELTGLDGKKDSIVSIGGIEMHGRRIELGAPFYRLINPDTGLTAASVVIHEITPDEVSQKPDIAVVLAEFLQFLGTDIVVGFCVEIDMEFLNRETKKLLGTTIQNPVIDILPIFEWIRKKDALQGGKRYSLPQKYKLYDMALCFGISVSNAHNAAVDAFITAQIFQRLIPAIACFGINNTADLISLGNPSKGGEKTGNFAAMFNL